MDFLMQPMPPQLCKAMGGVGFVQHSYGHVFLTGKVYLRCAAAREQRL